MTVTLGAEPQWSPGPIKCPWTVNSCWVGGETGWDGGTGVGDGDGEEDTDTELKDVLISDDCADFDGSVVHTSDTGAMTVAWMGGVLLTDGVVAALVTAGKLALSLVICERGGTIHTHTYIEYSNRGDVSVKHRQRDKS